MQELKLATTEELWEEVLVRQQLLAPWGFHPDCLFRQHGDGEQVTVELRNPHGFMQTELNTYAKYLETWMAVFPYAVIHYDLFRSKQDIDFPLQLFAFLYVDKFQEDWDMERKDLLRGQPVVYVRQFSYNCWEERFIELGDIAGSLRDAFIFI